MSGLNIDAFVQRLREADALRESDDILHGVQDRIEPDFAEDWPTALDARVRDSLVAAGMSRPYKHQAEAIELALTGADVVVESPTASGKTLAFVAPMLHVLKSHPAARAMMIYPMKALAFDQREQLRQLCRPLGIESWPYDGDADNNHKEAIRQNPTHILLTNPEYLNMSFLGERRAWDRHKEGAGFLRNLRYLVIDEMHEYRGFFGSNMALLLRRFFRYLDSIDVHPQVFLSTATCANPQGHANELTGRDVQLVSARGVFRPQRHFAFVSPDIPDFQYRDILRLRVEKAAMTALEEGLQILVFCPTKRFLEEAFRNCRRDVHQRGLAEESIAAFHADIRADQRQVIQQNIKSGKTRVVFTTNALEIGLDVGGLDGVILAGFPPSLMSAWQQIGRAGRGWDKDAFVLLYAMNDPIDKFFVTNMEAFLNKPFDELVVDAANEELIKRHLRSLLEETDGPVKPHEEPILGTPFYLAAYQEANVGGARVAPRSKPQQRLNLRGAIGNTYELLIGADRVGQVSESRRFREAYLGAVFPFYGRRYRVTSQQSDAVVLGDCEQHLRTDPRFFTTLTTRDVFDGLGYDGVSVYYGSLNVLNIFNGFRLVDERTNQQVGSGDDSDALTQNNLHAFWFDVDFSDNLLKGIGAVEHMLRVGTMFVIPSDRFDTSTLSYENKQYAYCYENYPGGIGIVKRLFQRWNIALERGMDIARNCSCKTGCPDCIEPAKSWDINNPEIDKGYGILLGQALLDTYAKGPTYRFDDGLMRPI